MNEKLSLNETIDIIKSIRKVIAEKGSGGKNKGDRLFSMYCFLLEHSTCPHGWTPPMTLIDIATCLEKRERTVHRLMKDMVDDGLVERERVGGVYRYKLIDLDINYVRKDE